MEQQIRFCTTSDGVRIAYATVGEGPPLIQIPGWVSHLEVQWENPQFRNRLEELAQHFLVVRLDKRGTGLSDRSVSDFSINARVLDLEAVVDHLKLRRCALMGLSEGGPVAIAYAARHPRRVSRLILYGTFARMNPTPERQETIDALVALVRAEWGLGSRTLSDLFMPGGSPEEVQGFVKLQQEGATSTDAAAMLKANVETDVFDLLAQVKAPTLVVHVKGDLVIPFESGRELAGSITNARLVPIEGDRHVPNATGMAQFQQAVLDFLLEDEHEKDKEEPGAPAAKAPAGPLTILFTDMESSTALTQRLGDAKAQELVRAHNTIVRDALKAHSGSEIKHTGDGIMASFAAASTALNCAIAIQRAVEAQPGETPFRLHIGLNAGEPVAEEDDLFGTAVQLASRICGQAEPAQILASDVVRQLVAGKDFLFSDRGDIALRGFEDPVRLYEVRWREAAH
jgi:class 3 adenylate cyclase